MKTDCGELKKGNGCALDYFEKNAYFHGKLITARDMIAEQKVHEDKLYMINRLTLGNGIVCGLKVEKIEKSDGKLKVEIQPGMAIDCCGRILVVKGTGGTITKEVTRFENNRSTGPGPGDTVYLYLKYKECLKEAVPVQGAGDACEEKCCYNRILEVFDVVYKDDKDETQDISPPPEIDFPSREDFESDKEGALLGLAQDYYDQYLKSKCRGCTEPIVFLGAFKKNGEGIWKHAGDETKKYLSVVYNNKMLYDILARHVTRFDNPHEVTAEQTRSLMSVNEVGNRLEKDEDAWVQNINLTPAEYPDDPEHEDNTIGITPENAENRIKLGVKSNSITTTHIRDNTIAWNDLNEEDVRDKIVRQIGGVTPGTDDGNIDIIEGENIEIIPDKDSHAIEISCKSKDAALIHMGHCVFKEVKPGEIRISEPISHDLEGGDVGIILADELENQILLGDREHFADLKEFGVSPALAVKVKPSDRTFMIFLKNLDVRERTFVVRWWAIQATRDIGICKGEHPPSEEPEERDTGVFDRSSFDQAKFGESKKSPGGKFNGARFSRSVFS